MFHGVIHKITLAQFFLRHGVDVLINVLADDLVLCALTWRALELFTV